MTQDEKRAPQRGDREEFTQESRYKVIAVDLTAARTDPERIAKLGSPIATVAVVSLPGPAAGVLSIRVGADGDFIPLNVQGMELRPARPERGGLFIKNTAVAQTVLLLVSFEEAPLYVSI